MNVLGNTGEHVNMHGENGMGMNMSAHIECEVHAGECGVGVNV